MSGQSLLGGPQTPQARDIWDLEHLLRACHAGPRPLGAALVHFGRGRTLQPALYAVALEQMLARERPGSTPHVAESGYLFPSRRGEGDEIMVRDFDRGRLRSLLGDLLALLEKGYFVAGPEPKCDYCDYRAACLSGGPDRSAAKREANPEVFAAYDRLDEYN